MQTGLTAILADGDFPSSERTLNVLRGAERIVCCDGAADTLVRHGLEPCRIVGDLDSLSPELKCRFADRLVHVEEQESNDLSKAWRYCVLQGWRNLVILGATGKREDHLLGNLSLLADFAKVTPQIFMLSDHGSFQAVDQPGEFAGEPGQQISIFALDSDTPVTSEGLKFPMNPLVLHRWWQATLNQAEGERFTLHFPPGRQLLIYRAFLH